MISTAALNKEAFWFTRQGDASTACKQTRDFMNFYFATVASKECPFPTVTGDTADKGIELGVVVIADVTQNLDHVSRWYVCVSWQWNVIRSWRSNPVCLQRNQNKIRFF